MERIYVGGLAEASFQNVWQTDREKRLAAQNGVAELRNLQDANRSVPVSDRRAFAKSTQGRQRAEDIDLVIREIRRTPAFVETVSRHFPLAAPRPKGVHWPICEHLAAELSAKWELPNITPRYVDRCWKEYRKFEKETRPPDD